LLTLLSHHKDFSEVGQPCDTLVCTISLLCGELFGNYCNAALHNMFIAQATEGDRHAQRVEQLEGEKQRIEYELRFSQRALADASATSREKCVISHVPSSMELASALSETGGLPRLRAGIDFGAEGSKIAAGHIAEGLLQNDSGVGNRTWDTKSKYPAPVFQLEGERNLEPVSNLFSCGSSTVGSCSEIASAFEADGEATMTMS
jgi:hypothetical protein